MRETFNAIEPFHLNSTFTPLLHRILSSLHRIAPSLVSNVILFYFSRLGFNPIKAKIVFIFCLLCVCSRLGWGYWASFSCVT